MTAVTSTVNAHGICRTCSKRTWLWLPGRLCTKCDDEIAVQMYAAMERVMADDNE